MCVEQSEEWLASRVYLDMSKLEEAAAASTPTDEEVTIMAA